MIKILNIVNGDTCIHIMKKAKIEGDFLAWNDFLHEGPIPLNLSLTQLSKVRAKFISDYGLGSFQALYHEFVARNQKLSTYNNYEKIILWFEHDLYDQLQLLQVLCYFEQENVNPSKLNLICTNHYLGESSEEEIKQLENSAITLSKEHLTLATKAWSAFRASTPLPWFNLLQENTELLPFLKVTVLRMLEEYPHAKHGLSRSQYQALASLANGIDEPLQLLLSTQKLEERKFMGDSLFWKILEEFEAHKVINRIEGRLTISPLGKRLIKAQETWLSIKQPIQRSIGGVTLSNEHLWCWDSKNKTIEKYYFSTTLNMLLKVK